MKPTLLEIGFSLFGTVFRVSTAVTVGVVTRTSDSLTPERIWMPGSRPVLERRLLGGYRGEERFPDLVEGADLTRQRIESGWDPFQARLCDVIAGAAVVTHDGSSSRG